MDNNAEETKQIEMDGYIISLTSVYTESAKRKELMAKLLYKNEYSYELPFPQSCNPEKQ